MSTSTSTSASTKQPQKLSKHERFLASRAREAEAESQASKFGYNPSTHSDYAQMAISGASGAMQAKLGYDMLKTSIDRKVIEGAGPKVKVKEVKQGKTWRKIKGNGEIEDGEEEWRAEGDLGKGAGGGKKLKWLLKK